MSLKKQHKPHLSIHRSNDMFIRPSAVPISKMNKENPDKKVANTGFDPEVKLNHFGEPAFFQPQNTVQARMKMSAALPKANKSESRIQKMPDEDQEVQTKAKKDSPPSVHSSSTDGNSHTKNNTGMPSNLMSGLEELSGEDLSGVRVHRNSSKPEEIDAHAYTQGENIYLAPGQEKHLPHEGWHVVQQKQGRVQPTIQQKSKLINNEVGLEREADIMGERAMQMKSKNAAPEPNKTRFSQRNEVIQKAMKFEYQFKGNYLNLDDGSEVYRLPRKFGPRDYLIRDTSGARLETETNGQIEFETPWEKKWTKLKEQIKAVQDMSNKMDGEPKNEMGSDGKMYRKLPASWGLEQLHANRGSSVSSKSNRWSRRQKDGKAIVRSKTEEFENFRTTPNYNKNDPQGNFIRKIKNDKKVFVHYTKSNWSKIEYKGTLGWMWNGSLIGMENKDYEQNNPDSRDTKSDKPMTGSEKLLIEVTDPDWKAYTQISESMELEQYESYLSQHDSYRATTLVPDVEKLILDNNSQTPPSGETSTEKDFREKAFLDSNIKLKNLLLMVSYYIEKGRTQSTMNQGKPGSAKYALSLMSRTHFGSIFNTLTPNEQLLFAQVIKNLTDGILPRMGLDDRSVFFMYGTTYGYNPTVYDWLMSISGKGDILSSQSKYKSKLPGAMGKFNVGDETGKQEGLIRMEGRRTSGNNPKLVDLLTHAEKHFDAARSKRPRKEGSGETGLEKPVGTP